MFAPAPAAPLLVFGGDVLHRPGDLFGATDLLSLAGFDHPDELRSVEQRFVGPGVEPGATAAEDLHVEPTPVQVGPVDVGDFQFTARRGLEIAGDLHHVVVVEVQAGHGEVGPRLPGLLFDLLRLALLVEDDHAVSFRVVNMVGKYLRAAGRGVALLQLLAQQMAVEDVVSQDQARRVAAYEVGPDDERLGQSARVWLFRITEIQANFFAGAQQPFQ